MNMKCLQIESGKGYFSVDGNEWILLDQITKEDILKIITSGLQHGFELDSPIDKEVKNKAHEIIYKNLQAKFTELNEQKSRFKDESENLFKEALVKYKE